MNRRAFTVTGMDCGECAAKMEHALRRLNGVSQATASFGSSRLVVSWEPDLVDEARIRREVHSLGFETHDSLADAQRFRKSHAVRRLWPVAAIGISVLGGWLAGSVGWEPAGVLMYAFAIAVGLAMVGRRAVGSLRSSVLDINVLMAVAVVGAVLIRRLDEAAVVVFLFILGEWLEEYAVDRTRGSVLALMQLAPPTVRLLRNGSEVEVSVESVAVGDIARIRPGETIPVDGEVTANRSLVDESTLTGESVPVAKEPGDVVFAGTSNQNGALEVRVTHPAGENTLDRIVEMVQAAQSGNSWSERFVNRFSRVYTPVILILAGLTAVVPPTLYQVEWSRALYTSLALLVAACPCALVISTPVAIVSALGAASRQGILIKSGYALEELSRVKFMLFDKTGTLTEGFPTVVEVATAAGVDEEALISAAAAVECHASHPLAHALLLLARERNLPLPEVRNFVSTPGRGVSGVVDGTLIRVGADASTSDVDTLPEPLRSAADRLEQLGCTVLYVHTDHATLGIIGVQDRPRRGVSNRIVELRRSGIRRIGLLSGDSQPAAQSLASALGIPEVTGRLLPGQKRDAVLRWRERGPVAMVGDGINDAPALAAANVGIAMGAAGSDAAIEAADIALMGDDLGHITDALNLGRRTASVVRQNVIIALGLKTAFLLALAAGHATLWMAVAADMGASLLVTLNAMRLMAPVDRYRPDLQRERNVDAA